MRSKLKLSCLLLLLTFLPLTGAASAQDRNDLDDPQSQRIAPFQVFDNLYYIGARWVAAWLLVSDQGLIVFDSLYGELTEIAIENIRELGFDPNDIRYLVVSHAHYDHVGGARRFQDEFSPVVMMTEEDWQMTTEPAQYRDYPTPVRHLSATTGGVINLGRTRVHFMQTPGHTPGVLSAFFTVYDDGYPHTAFMFGGAGLNFSGVDRTETYIDSVQRIQRITDIEVNIPNHPGFGEVFERYQQLQDRKEGDPHPFVDPEGFYGWLDELLAEAEAKLAEER